MSQDIVDESMSQFFVDGVVWWGPCQPRPLLGLAYFAMSVPFESLMVTVVASQVMMTCSPLRL